MLNHDTGQMDWDQFPIGGQPPASSSYYINPQNMYDVATPRGRELMDEIYPSFHEQRDFPAGEKGSPLIFAIILVVMFVGFFIIPVHS